MMAMLAFQAVRSAVWYFFSRTNLSTDPNRKMCGPPWMRRQGLMYPRSTGYPLQEPVKFEGECDERRGRMAEATATKEGVGDRMFEGSKHENPTADNSIASVRAHAPLRNETVAITAAFESNSTAISTSTSNPALVTPPIPSSLSVNTSATPSLPTVASLMPLLLKALPNLRTGATTLQTLLASNDRLASAPVTGYLREALTVFVWVCDVVDVLGSLNGSKGE